MEGGGGRGEEAVAAGAQANRAVRDNSLAGRFFTAVRNRILLVERKSSVATKHTVRLEGLVALRVRVPLSTPREGSRMVLPYDTFSI